MNIKLILFIIIVLIGFVLSKGRDSDGNRKIYIFVIISILILVSCLRSHIVGPDTSDYYNFFLNTTQKSWSDIWNLFRDTYFLGEGKDPGYSLLMKLFNMFSTNWNFFLFITDLFFFIPLGIILYRYSTHIIQLVFAFSLYVALFFIVALSGIRQQIAIGFTFIAFLCLDKGKNIQSILFVIIGAFIHISALIFLIVIALKFFMKKGLKVLHCISFFTIPVGILFSSQIILFLSSLIKNDYYAGYASSTSSGGAVIYITLMELLSLFCYIGIKKKIIDNNRTLRLFYITLPLLTFFVPLISFNGSMIRIGQYFTLYMMLLFPFSIDLFFIPQNRLFAYLVAIFVVVILALQTKFSYYFFWQTPWLF